MNALVSIVEESLVNSRLEELGVDKESLIEVIQGAVGARNSATPFHPKSAAGLLAWIEGTYSFRSVFASKGWEPCSQDNVESIVNNDLGLRFIYQNAEQAGDIRKNPIATSLKGAGTERVVASGQAELFPEISLLQEEQPLEVWYLFVYANGLDVRAELSRPTMVLGGKFFEFHERIILVQEGEWLGPEFSDNDTDVMADIEVTVSRKAQ